MPTQAMTMSAPHGGQRFLLAWRSPTSRCQIASQRALRCVKPSASGGFHSDPVGASSSTDATAAPVSRPPPSKRLALYFISVFGHLRHNANSIAQHLSNTEHASFLPSLGRGLGAYIRIASVEPNQGPSPQQLESREQPQDCHHLSGSHVWISAILSHVPWSYPGASASPVTDSGAAFSSRAAAQASRPLPSSQQSDLAGSAGDLHYQDMAVHSAVALLWWHSAVTLQQRVVVTVLWLMGQAVEAADKARRSMPPPAKMPGLMHWGAVSAAARAEETVALALVHTVAAASVAAAGLPTAVVAVTGSAAAAAGAAAVAAPHLPLLRHARDRLLVAATQTLERLRDLQRGCTTHVLLRFLLFSAVNPRLLRDLWVRLDVLALRAAQVALLQDQHDEWLARQRPMASSPSASLNPQPSYPRGSTSGATPATPKHGSSVAMPSSSSSSSSLPSSAASSGAGDSVSVAAQPPLSARWYRHVFAPEMLACARQLQVGAPGSAPDDQTAGDPPGRFDLRDLYRLIRVIEVAVEDLERYNVRVD